MKTNLEHLMVAVVPTETGNDIDQSSEFEEIVECEETVLYPLTSYFQAQNDEELPLLNWTFLLDMEQKIILNDMNL